ncbi:hypothetical protein SNE40_019385 [Patella caerulea]|uniref:Uncharacterized protein n=1 Tax=Patella caerulea TaxID=87958 RepID=A0AAN8J7Y8_PATCE
MEDATLLEVLYLIVVSGAVMVIFKRSMSMICISISLMTILLIIIRRITRSRLPVKNKTVLITGCETEAGLELVRSLDSKGFQVLATFKSVNSNGVNILKKNCSDKLRILELDVTSDTSCRKCLNEVKSQLGENDLWAVVNNASDTLIGDVELTTIEQYKTIIDVNLLGTIRVTQTFLPLIRLSQGRIVNISSVGGLMGIPYGSAFSASKYGVEGFTESLRLEMIKFGVRVSLVEPSLSYQLSSQSSKALKQSCEEMKFKASEDILETYGEDYISGMCNEFINKNNHLNHSDVCEAVTDAILLEHHTTRYVVGDSHRMLNSSKWIAKVRSCIPSVWFDSLVFNLYGTKLDTAYEIKQYTKEDEDDDQDKKQK